MLNKIKEKKVTVVRNKSIKNIKILGIEVLRKTNFLSGSVKKTKSEKVTNETTKSGKNGKNFFLLRIQTQFIIQTLGIDIT